MIFDWTYPEPLELHEYFGAPVVTFRAGRAGVARQPVNETMRRTSEPEGHLARVAGATGTLRRPQPTADVLRRP